MKTTQPKYAAHGEPGTEAWIEVYAENCTEAEKRHAIYAHAPELLAALETALKYLHANTPKGNVRKIFSELNAHACTVKAARAAIAKARGA